MNDSQTLSYFDTRSAAAKSINDYFRYILRGTMDITLDELVKNCMTLSRVQEFIEGEHKECTAQNAAHLDTLQRAARENRKQMILNHISMKIKEYIDGKF